MLLSPVFSYNIRLNNNQRPVVNVRRKKRTFEELRSLILLALRKNNLTKNQISAKTGIRWEVVSHQLVTLRGLGYVDIFFEHEKMTIYTMTKDGEKYLIKIKRSSL